MKESKEYHNPVEVMFGNRTLEKIPEIADKYSSNKKVLLVTGRSAMRKQGVTQRIEALLGNNDYEVKTFEKVGSNPTLDLVDEGSEMVRNEGFGLVIGLGGGSAMDCAKCMTILGNNKGTVLEYLKGERKISDPSTPLIEIPTTSGTGSEVTMWATVWDMNPGSKKKYSLSDRKMYAKAAIVDPELTSGLPPRMTAITGMDALCQAIEAYWSRNHNPTSDSHALKAIRLIYYNLENAFNEPDNIGWREKVALGSLEAGLAFSNTKTTAVHSTSYPMTAHFGVPHGLACALTLGEFMKYNSVAGDDNIPDGPERLQKISEVMGCASAEEAAARITELMKRLDMPTTLRECGIDKEGVKLIIDEGFTPDRVKHNPRKVTEKGLREILNKII